MKQIKKRILLLAMLLVFVLAGCSGTSGSGQEQQELSQAQEDSGSTILTIVSSEKEESTYSLEQLEALGTETLSYSGRNKEENNARQIREYTGVLLETLLQDIGYQKGEKELILKVICSDGYTREYELDSLKNLYFFESDKAEKGEPVAPMLAIIKEGESLGNDKSYEEKAGSPLRLVFGQADYDSEYTKDFNMQGWASYVEKIEVSKSNE